jgi:hypothetical protein
MGMTKTNRISVAFWLIFVAVCFYIPRLRANELRRAEWAQTLNYDGDPETGDGAVFFAAVGWNDTTLEVATMENGAVACDVLLGAIVNGDNGFARELRSRGFRSVECNGTTRAVGQPQPKAAPSTKPRSNTERICQTRMSAISGNTLAG